MFVCLAFNYFWASCANHFRKESLQIVLWWSTTLVGAVTLRKLSQNCSAKVTFWMPTFWDRIFMVFLDWKYLWKFSSFLAWQYLKESWWEHSCALYFSQLESNNWRGFSIKVSFSHLLTFIWEIMNHLKMVGSSNLRWSLLWITIDGPSLLTPKYSCAGALYI